jgi:beta-lactamase regulating signal transducer with metallopeptidase domain
MTVQELFVSATLAQVTLITVVALIVIWFGRRHSAFRHAAGVVGLVLVVGSPLLVLALPRPAWLEAAKPAADSTSRASGQSAILQPTAAPANPGSAAEPDFPGNRMPRGASVTAEPHIPDSVEIPEVADYPAAVRPVSETPLIPEPAPLTAASSATTAGPRRPGEAVPARPAGVAVVPSRAWGLSTLFHVLSAVWCLGILWTAFRDWRRRRELRIITDATWHADLDRVTRAAQDVRLTLGLRELPRIHVSKLAPLPFVLGVWKPIVVLPSDMAASASNERLRDVLIHECAHIVRKDSWVHLLQRISAVVFWFHPAVVWLNVQIGRAREELCDNFVLLTGDAAEYAETLLDLSESCGGKRLGPSALGLAPLGLFSTRWTLEQRVGGLLDPSRDKTTRAWRGTLVLLTVLFASLSLLVGGVGLIAREAAADAKPDVAAAGTAEVETEAKAETPAPTVRKITIRGKCVDDGGSPVANAVVRVLQDRLMIGTISQIDSDPMVVIAELKSDASGEFAFHDVELPLSDRHPQRQRMLYVAATAAGRASAVALESVMMNYAHDLDELKIGFAEEPFILSQDRQTVSGVVTDPAGRPVAGARVSMGTAFGNPIPGMWSAVTDQAGKYAIYDLERWKITVVEETDPDGTKSTITTRNSAAAFNSGIRVLHPQYALTTAAVGEVPGTVNVKLKPAAIVEGKVIDQVTGQPAAAVVVFAKGIGRDELALVKTDVSGRYRFQLSKDHYNIWVESQDRIAAVLKAVPAVPDQPVTDADFRLVRGGVVVGTVIDDATNQPLVGSKDKPYIVAHYGPACMRMERQSWMVGEPELSIGVQQETRVNPDGSFRLRVAPGRNGVFFIENYGETEQSPQIVTIADGEEKRVELRVALSVPDEPGASDVGRTTRSVVPWTDDEFDADRDRFFLIRRDAYIEKEQAQANAGEAVKNPALAKIPSRERRDSPVNRLLDKFERQSIGNDNYRDPWLRTIKDIVDFGPAAVPELLEELDATEDPWILQLLGFVLRAIDDRRAVPALIRAIPRTLPSPEPEKHSFTAEEWQMYRHPATKIMLTATDPALRAFAQGNQLEYYIEESRDQDRQRRYTFDSPAREICGAITKLTGAHNGEEELLAVERYHITSPDQLRARQQLFQRVANNWSEWWQQHQNDPVVALAVSPAEIEAIQAVVHRGGTVKRDGTKPGSPVTRVSFHGEKFDGEQGVTEDDLKLLKAFPNLQELWMPLNVDPPAGGMKMIGQLHSLTSLDLGTTNAVGRSNVGPGLKELRGLSQLQSLSLGNITNEDLKEIARFKTLRKLQIFGFDIDDRGIKELRGLENLEELDGVGSGLTDAGAANLAEVKSLKILDLSHSKITDAGLAELNRLRNLKSLDLSSTKIKGLGISELKDLQHLTSLKMNSTRVTDAVASRIAELKSLTSLYLTNTKITDAALKHFEQLPDLQYLEVKETEVTDEAASAAGKARPGLHIVTE